MSLETDLLLDRRRLKRRLLFWRSFAVGEKVDAKIVTVDRASRKLSLTIKGKEVEEEKQAMAEFGSSDSGASLGDILGAAINRSRVNAEKTEKEEE